MDCRCLFFTLQSTSPVIIAAEASGHCREIGHFRKGQLTQAEPQPIPALCSRRHSDLS